MGRSTEDMIQTRVRLPSKIVDFIKAEAERQAISVEACHRKLLKKGIRLKRPEDTGFRWIKHMSQPYTCFECQKQKPKGDPAWQNDVDGATMCPECGEFKHGLSSDVNVKQDQKLWKAKKLKRDYMTEVEKKRVEYDEFEKRINNLEIVQKIHDGQNKMINEYERVKRVQDYASNRIADTKMIADYRIMVEGHLRLIDKREKILDLILEKKEKEAWERLKREAKKKRRQKQIYRN